MKANGKGEHMSRDNYDPVTGKLITPDPEFPIWERRSNSNPAPPERGTINHEGRAEKFILDMPGRRSEPGCGEEAEKNRPPIIRG
jgi:hypothetical protein